MDLRPCGEGSFQEPEKVFPGGSRQLVPIHRHSSSEFPAR